MCDYNQLIPLDIWLLLATSSCNGFLSHKDSLLLTCFCHWMHCSWMACRWLYVMHLMPALMSCGRSRLCRYIRYIFNRIILENATVRAAAVTALAQFGAKCPTLQQRVVLLLKRALYDNDDEVRTALIYAGAWWRQLGVKEHELGERGRRAPQLRFKVRHWFSWQSF